MSADKKVMTSLWPGREPDAAGYFLASSDIPRAIEVMAEAAFLDFYGPDSKWKQVEHDLRRVYREAARAQLRALGVEEVPSE